MRIRKINGLLVLPRLHFSSTPSAGEAVQTEEGERSRGALGDSRLGKLMATQEGTRAAVCTTSPRPHVSYETTRRRGLMPPSHMVLGGNGQEQWEGGLQRASDGGESCE